MMLRLEIFANGVMGERFSWLVEGGQLGASETTTKLPKNFLVIMLTVAGSVQFRGSFLKPAVA